MSSRAACVALLLGAMALVAATAWAANAPIYKCLDNHLGLVYTDQPCKDGEKLDIRAGDADPVAVASLARVRDQLDQSAAQRMLDERRAALAAQLSRGPGQDYSAPPAMTSPFDDGYGYLAYPYFRRPPLLHPRPHRPHEQHGFAPSPPYIVPRP